KAGMAAEVHEEIGNVARFGLIPHIFGESNERIRINDKVAITNYLAVVHDLKREDGTRISLEEMVQIADKQFEEYSKQTLPSGELKGVHLWEVTGYPVINLKDAFALRMEGEELFIECDVIRPMFDSGGGYIGVEIQRETLPVQPTIAPMIG